MKKTVIFVIIGLLFSFSSYAQVPSQICVKKGSNCVPISTTAPLPIGVYDSGNHSGYCYTSNGSGSPATFQSCGSGGTTPGGSNGQFQYNNSNAFGGIGGTANTILGYTTANTAAALAVPSCSASSSALTWTTGTGFGCNTISGGGGSVTVGTSVTVPTPYASGSDTQTGLYTTGSGNISFASLGTSAVSITSSGINLPNNGEVIYGAGQPILKDTFAGVGNLYVGYDAGMSVTTAGEMVAIGNIAGQYEQSGAFDTFIGQHAAGYDVNSSTVTCVGNDVCRNSVAMSGTTAVGKGSYAYGSEQNSVFLGSAWVGNSGSIIIGGTGDGGTINVTFTCTPQTGYTCSYSGSPITISITTTNGDSAATMATNLTAAINANTTINNQCGIPATAAVLGAPYSTSAITIQCIGTSATGIGLALTSSVTGGSTETISTNDGAVGQNNIAIGGPAAQGRLAQTASYNFAAGKYVLNNLTTGNYNISIGGYNTAQNVTTGSNNLIFCQNCATNLTTGSSNIVMGGTSIGNTNLTTGSSNILIGPSTLDALTSGGSNYIDIGNVYFGDDSTKSAWIGNGSLATSATDGFIEISSAAGIPTGTPTAHSGYIPLVYNSSANTLYAYNSGWQNLTAPVSVLGTAVGSPSPYKSGDTTTGLYSSATATVSVSGAGSDVLDISSTGLNMPTAGTISQGGAQTIKIVTNGGVSVGGGAGYASSTTDVGYKAGNATQGAFSTAIGYNTALTATGGVTTFIGAYAGAYSNNGSVVGVGGDAMEYYNGNGSQTAVGYNALQRGTGDKDTGVGSGALQGNSAAIAVGGSSTNGDVLTATFTGSFTGSPVSPTYTVVTSNTNLQNAQGLAAAINANSTLTAASITATSGTAPSGTVYIILQYPGGTSYATVTTSVSGSATETLTATNGSAGFSNVGIGYQALLGIYGMTSSNNVGIGSSSCGGLTSGGSNTCIGATTGALLTTGSQNVIIGATAGNTTLATGSADILIGYGVDATTSSTSNYTSLGGSITITGTNTKSTEAITLNGTVTLPNIATDATHTDATICEDTTSHTLYFGSGTLGICLGTSSARYKNSIIDLKDGLAEIEALKPVNFYYNKDHGDFGAREQYGFIAEDVIKVLPKLTHLDKDGQPNGVDIVGMVPVLVKAIQQQQKEIADLKMVANGHPCFFDMLICTGDN